MIRRKRQDSVHRFDLDALSELVEHVETRAKSDSDALLELSALATFADEPSTLQKPEDAEISAHLAWLPYSLNEALATMALSRIVNRRLAEGYYRDRLIVLTTQEKSASTLHEIALQKMQQYEDDQVATVPVPRSLHGGPLAMAGHAAFHFGLLHYFPSGGVCRGEFIANPQNIWMIRRTLDCRTVVLTRHPADRLVALFCMRHEGLRGRMVRSGISDTSDEAVLNTLFVGPGHALPANIGALRHNLEWLEGWVQDEARERSVLARYEDMVADPIGHFTTVHGALYRKAMASGLEDQIEAAIASSGEGGALQSGDAGTRSYPKGYTGKQGIWRDYLSDKNIAVYNEFVERFLSYSPYAKRILEIYPDLLLENEAGANRIEIDTTSRPAGVAIGGDTARRDVGEARLPSGEFSTKIARLEQAAADDRDIEMPLKELRDLVSDSAPDASISDDQVFPRIAWLPHTLREALPFVGLSRVISKRMREGYYKDKLVVLITQEKSSSTLHEVVIRKMLRYSGNVKVIMPLPRNLICGPVTMTGGATFHPGMLYYFPNGGVLRGVFSPTGQNNLILNEVGCRKIVLARHPADRIVAQYCMRFNEYVDFDMEQGIDEVIAGSLPSNLDWLCGWVKRAKNREMLIVRYEDMMIDKTDHFTKIHDFLYPAPMGDELASEIKASYSRSGEGGSLRSGDLTTRVYPKGYSGKVGIWRDYLTEVNVESYNTIVKRYLDANSDAARTLEIYPDLLLDKDAVGAKPTATAD